MKDTVVIYSGGMDSYTLLMDTLHKDRLFAALSFDYGQRHIKELTYARSVTRRYGIIHNIIDMKPIADIAMHSVLTDASMDLPTGHYAEESMKQTVVPNRNMVMLSIAIAYAVSHHVDVVAFGAHAGDHTIYPDCRPQFVTAMDVVATIANWRPVRISAPFLKLDKAAILEIGLQYPGVDYSGTWTCYVGGGKACGQCGSCSERLEAFAKIGKTDPLEYEQHG